jgi:putative ABC transport system substrate-binding protein
MKRREFMTMLGGAAAAWPLTASAQPTAMPVIGFLTTRSPDESNAHTAAFLRGLDEAGYVAGRNVAIEYRWGNGQYERLPALAAELAGLRPAIIVAGGDPSALAAYAVTKTVPIVFIMGDDPVRMGCSNTNSPNVRRTST